MWPFRPKPTPVQSLVSSALTQLPLPPEILKSHASEVFDDPSELLVLANHYDRLKQSPAWLHFTGELLRLKDIYEQGILRGERDRFGEDISPAMRGSYGTLLQILAIPEQVKTTHLRQEESIMGRPQIDPIDFQS